VIRPNAARLLACVAALLAAGHRARAQQADSAHCDSIVAAARVDSVRVGLFLGAHRTDGPPLEEEQMRQLMVSVGAAFVPPKPFRLTVFSGPARSRSLRTLGADSTTTLRAPTVTGVYRITATAQGVANILIVRMSLVPGFDSSATDAIRVAATGNPAFATPVGVDTMHVDISFSTDSSAGARRLVSAAFPRMPVVDVAPMADNPAPEFPDAAKADSLDFGEVVLRFVVARDGTPEFDTLELIRSSDPSFTRAALRALAKHRFRPATIRGCTVAQQIDYAFNFSLPGPDGR
jgi:TonB family protein